MSAKLRSQPGGECGYFLCGNIVRTGDVMVVAANKQYFNVIPPSGGELWVTLAGRPADIRIGDDARVSFADAVPIRASVVNLYRRDEADSATEAKSTAKTAAKSDDKGSINDSPKATNRKSATKGKSKSAAKSDSKPTPQSAAETQFRLGMNMLANGNREKAIDYFKKARELDSSDAMRDRISDALTGKSTKGVESKDDK
jgi:hypothetical protein